jgi:hypothetical protein
MISSRIASMLLVTLAGAVANANVAVAEDQPKTVPGLTVADPNAGWVEIAPDTTLVPTQDTSVAADSGEQSEQ